MKIQLYTMFVFNKGRNVMEANYKKLWMLLIEYGLTRTQLRQKAKISTVSLAKLGKGQRVSVTTLNKICGALGCHVHEIVEITDDGQPIRQIAKSKPSVVHNSISDVFQGKHYISHEELCEYMQAHGSEVSTRSMNNKVLLWKKEGVLFSSGRGWYSDIPDDARLDVSPISPVMGFLRQKYPLLDFQCWSTQQLLPFFHHLPGKYYTFIYCDGSALNDLSISLQEAFDESTVRIKPKATADDFVPKERNYILLPMPKAMEHDPMNGPMQIESVLVEFAHQAKRLDFSDEREVFQVIHNLVSRYRVNMAKLQSIAIRRHDSDFARNVIA